MIIIDYLISAYETLRIENGMVTQNNAFMDSLQLAEEDLGAQV